VNTIEGIWLANSSGTVIESCALKVAAGTGICQRISINGC
jgi:hypothetical protein